MKFFKIFKKKSPTSTNQVSSNLVCNIHWAEVQRELTQGVKEMRPGNNAKLNYHKTSFQRDQVNGFKDNNGWNSCDEENYSSGENSWSSVSLSSSSKTTSANQFPEENFSRASSPGTEAVQSCMIDDISLEDVEQFEERRLEEKVKQVENIHYISRPLVTNVEQSYKASCLEVHDRWLGVQNVLKEEEEDEDNVSCMVNINMDIRTSSQLDSRFDMDTRSPDSSSSVMMNNTYTTHHMMPPHCEHRYHQHA